MAGKCKEMNKIKQVLRLHLDGESNRSIGRKLDLYKGTVNKYITLAESCGVTIPVLLAVEGRRSLNIDTNALQVIRSCSTKRGEDHGTTVPHWVMNAFCIISRQFLFLDSPLLSISCPHRRHQPMRPV